MEDRIDLVAVEADEPRQGVGLAVFVSIIVHMLLIIYVVRSYRPMAITPAAAPIVHYVELMRQAPKQFTEAPGKKSATTPLSAPYSDANRKASMPHPTGDQPTIRPGESGPAYVPPTAAGDNRPAQQQQPSIQQPAEQLAQRGPTAPSAPQQSQATLNGLTYRKPVQSASAGGVDWRDAITAVGKQAVGSGQRGFDLSGAGGGEKGFAESGPLSFETQWYDWGPYAASMVSRIRVNWYGNMPELIKTGLKGVVTIRFTIHRDGRISDVQMLSTSSVPPYDFAAKKAIELSSPLNALPKDFPNESERVTCMFFYNQEPPAR